MPTTVMGTMEELFSNVWFSAVMTFLAIIFLLSLLVIAYISYRQRRKITELVKQLEEGGKNSSQLAELNEVVDNSSVIVIKETPASQVWESDECVFYDLGSVSRATSRDTLDAVDTDDEVEEKRSLKRKESVRDEIREIDERTSSRIIEESKMDGGSIEGLTEEIWVGGNEVTRENKDTKNDAAEDSGNETTSNEDLLCTSGEEEGTACDVIVESASEDGDVKEDTVEQCRSGEEATDTSVDSNGE